MTSRRLFLSLSLAVCALFPVLGAQAATAGGPSAASQHGHMIGVWDKPTPSGPGHAAGVLTEDGAAAFRIRLQVLRNPGAPLPAGRIVGQLLDLPVAGATPSVVAGVRGEWVDGPNGPGRFRGVLLQPDPAGSGNPVVVGRIRGRFVDHAGGHGHFAGHWVLL